MNAASTNNVLVFGTNLSNSQSVKHIAWVFDQHPYITDWNVDLQDVDKVLRVVTTNQVMEHEVIDIVRTFGFHCEPLSDQVKKHESNY